MGVGSGVLLAKFRLSVRRNAQLDRPRLWFRRHLADQMSCKSRAPPADGRLPPHAEDQGGTDSLVISKRIIMILWYLIYRYLFDLVYLLRRTVCVRPRHAPPPATKNHSAQRARARARCAQTGRSPDPRARPAASKTSILRAGLMCYAGGLSRVRERTRDARENMNQKSQNPTAYRIRRVSLASHLSEHSTNRNASLSVSSTLLLSCKHSFRHKRLTERG